MSSQPIVRAKTRTTLRDLRSTRVIRVFRRESFLRRLLQRFGFGR